VVAVWTMGASGDQNPLFMSTYNQDSTDVHDEGAAGWALLDVRARRLGEEIVRVARNIQNTAGRLVLWAANGSATCPGRKRESTGPAGTQRNESPVSLSPGFGGLAPAPAGSQRRCSGVASPRGTRAGGRVSSGLEFESG
jgi:hypothetical protein